MSSKVIGLRLAPHVVEELERLCQLSGQTKAEVVTTLIMGVNGENGVNVAKPKYNKGVNKSVCVWEVGTKLPSTWDIKAYAGEPKGLHEKILGKLWYVFPEDRVVAVKKKSANGNKQWLEVVKVYPDEVWDKVAFDTEGYRVSNPVTKLEECLKRYQGRIARESHPIVIEAKQKGWQVNLNKYYAQRLTLEELLAEAEEYLAQLEATPAIAEVHSARSEMSPVLSEDIRTPEQTDVSPDQLVWLPVDDAREVSSKQRDETNKVPSQMSGEQFRNHYDLDTGVYGTVASSAKKKPYATSDGLHWKASGRKRNTLWTQVTPDGSADDTVTSDDT
ncbi:hypothetical protein H6F74_22665 [Trichocoleus sp. FACHB-90]|uniref:hypothetical protein n=1 Tax=Cyanophyceae TaxID=3028117 RepID=UPI001684609B|nr:hypothetical protein [Trichocoleus sp. FACHB-90]MBD1929027.1 hypothetical protein [Trichocoleus sp. FACHB-90]